MRTTPHPNLLNFNEFERTNQHIRWATIIVCFLTMPWWAEQAIYIYSFGAACIAYTLFMYLPAIRRSSIAHSPFLILLADGVFTLLLLTLVGSISTPYSGILTFIIITAAHIYRLRGALIVGAIAFLYLFLISSVQLFPPVELDPARHAIVTIFVLTTLGYQVSRLTHRDALERQTLRQLQQQSDLERGRLSTLIDNLAVAIFVTDSKGKIIQSNEAARIMTDSKTAPHDASLYKLFPLHKRTDPRATPVRLLNETSSASHRRDLCHRTPDGRTIDLDISVTPVVIDGVNTEYIVVCEDISQERTLDQERTEFISVAAHELRTPLAIMEAAMESAIITDENMAPQTKQLIEQAHRNARQLAAIVKDLSMLSESQNDNLPVQFEPINASDVLHQCFLDFEAQAKEKGLRLERTVSDDTPVILSTHRHIMEILQNYLTNAIKYSEQGAIRVTASRAKNDGILFSVTDQGVGISPADQKMLFTKFFRAESYLTRSTGGTGLGLYLCMELAQRIGAKLWAESEPNKGSTFYLEVPPQTHLKRDQGEVVEAQVANLINDL